MAFEYAKRGACLVLAGRREKKKRLREVADVALQLGSPNAVVVRAEVSDPDDCRRVIDLTIHHFGRLDHLVNNAGISGIAMLEDVENLTPFKAVIDVNFWGSVYMTKYAIPYLRNRRGRVVVISSSASWCPAPRMHVYNASKAALVQIFDSLMVELGSDIGVTIANPGWIESEMTEGKFLGRHGKMEVDTEMRDVLDRKRDAGCMRQAIVRAACRGDRYITELGWFKYSYLWAVFCPELVDYMYRILFVTMLGPTEKDSVGKKLVDYTGINKMLYPESIKAPEPRTEH